MNSRSLSLIAKKVSNTGQLHAIDFMLFKNICRIALAVKGAGPRRFARRSAKINCIIIIINISSFFFPRYLFLVVFQFPSRDAGQRNLSVY